MLKKRILLASLLKPVNDTRMFEKTGRSLARLAGVEVHIAGFAAKTPASVLNLFLHPVFNFPRLSWNRLRAQKTYWKLLKQLKPAIIIPNTYELLPATVLYKILHGATIIYDVRENYYANIRFQPTFPKPVRWLVANAVRLIEKFCARWVSHFWLAERSYADELTFLAGNYTILENKYQGPVNPVFRAPVRVLNQSLHLLYSGTISEVYGIWEALDLAEAMHKIEPATTLTIIGFCPLPATFQELKSRIDGKPYITLIGGDKLVPHPEIIRAIHKADLGLLPYRQNRSTWNCLPTKLFEYAANGLPCLIPENPYWEKPVKAWEAGFSVNFQEPDISRLLENLRNQEFYPNGIPEEAFWKNEEPKLLSFFTEKLLIL